jgi:5-methylcytosine-specific restriction endonuclease McrA
LDAELWRLDEGALWTICEEAEARRRADYVREVEVVAELWERSARTRDDHRAMVANLMALVKVTEVQAKELLRHAELFRREDIHDAAREGVLSKEHLKVLDATIAQAPEAERDKVAAFLVGQAAEFDAKALKGFGQRILQLLDQDGKEPDDPELARPTREFHFASRKDGSVVFRGKVDPESGAKLAALISPLAKPTSARDPRTTPERQGDAFAEIIELAAGSEDLPEEGGERPHLALTMSVREFMGQSGTAEMEGAGPLNAASVRRIACDSTVMRVILGAKSVPLNVGRTARTIPTQIRKALIIRDKGCAFPGCGRRPRQCHAHHVVHWADGGPTSLDNLTLLCGEHHRLIHHSNWSVTVNEGVPEFGLRAAGKDGGAVARR